MTLSLLTCYNEFISKYLLFYVLMYFLVSYEKLHFNFKVINLLSICVSASIELIVYSNSSL